MQLKQHANRRHGTHLWAPWRLGILWMLGHASLAKVPQTLAPLIELTLMRSLAHSRTSESPDAELADPDSSDV